RTEPEPEPVGYSTWSRWNNFDPDSNEFFLDAQREVFTDTPEYQRELREFEERLVRDHVNPDSPEASFAHTSLTPTNHGSNAPIIVRQTSSIEWEDRFHAAGAATGEWERVGATRN